MWDFLTKLLDTSDFPARWQCGPWTAGHGWLHIASDLAIFAAYAAIPLLLCVVFFRRRDIPFPPVSWGFVAFISLCGMTHLIEATLFWYPWYRLSGLAKLATAIVSWFAVLMLIRVMPAAIQLPGLARLNDELRREIAERRRVETDLRTRAAELERINEELESVSRLTVGREERIIELKREVNALLERAGEHPRYALRLHHDGVPETGA